MCLCRGRGWCLADEFVDGVGDEVPVQGRQRHKFIQVGVDLELVSVTGELEVPDPDVQHGEPRGVPAWRVSAPYF